METLKGQWRSCGQHTTSRDVLNILKTLQDGQPALEARRSKRVPAQVDAEIEKLWQDKEYRAKDMREEVRFQERAAETEKQNVLKSGKTTPK